MNSSSTFELIAERSLEVLEKATGQRRPITVKLGRPYWEEEGIEAACPVLIEGLLNDRVDIRGVDLLNATELAIRFINSYLKGTEEWSVWWPDGEPYGDEENDQSSS